ncbi:MAG: hypothetical protein LQ349_007622, partial [Xanthoria aureola]
PPIQSGAKGTGPVEQELDLITEVLDAHPQIVAHLAEFIDREPGDQLHDFIGNYRPRKYEKNLRVRGQGARVLEHNLYMLEQPGRSNSPRISDYEIEGSIGPLLKIITGTRDFKATDPRDKLLILFGISDEGLMPVLALTQFMSSNRDSLSTTMLKKYQKSLVDSAESVNNAGPGIDFGRSKALKPDYSKGRVLSSHNQIDP